MSSGWAGALSFHLHVGMSPHDGAGGGVGDSIQVSQWPGLIAQVGKGKNMTISAISHYRGGTIDEVAPLAKTLRPTISNTGSPIG